MASTDRGISNYVGPRQNGSANADLMEQPIQNIGSYVNPNSSNINTLDRDKGSAQLAGQSSNQIPNGLKQITYFLTAICSTGNIRKYWTDTAVSLSNAPSCGGGYVSNSLTILGKF